MFSPHQLDTRHKSSAHRPHSWRQHPQLSFWRNHTHRPAHSVSPVSILTILIAGSPRGSPKIRSRGAQAASPVISKAEVRASGLPVKLKENHNAASRTILQPRCGKSALFFCEMSDGRGILIAAEGDRFDSSYLRWRAAKSGAECYRFGVVCARRVALAIPSDTHRKPSIATSPMNTKASISILQFATQSN